MAASAELTAAVGRYQVLHALGGGGTALVFRARDRSLGLDVALKRLRPELAANPLLRRRFLREGELARQLTDSAIVQVLDVGEDAEGAFIAMELVEGQTLRQLMNRQRRFELPAARSVLVPLARALDHAHAAGIVHRDVKPENVFVHDWVVKLGDFGNARVMSLASVTGASLTWGTPEYAAPELFSRGRADPRSDLYALGVILYELLAGRLPWTRAEALGRIASHHAPPPPPSGAGVEVDRLLADLLDVSRDARPASGAEIVARLDAPGAIAEIRSTCPRCAAPRPDDVPRCLACGHEMLRLARGGGKWMVVLRRLSDDVAQVDRLLQIADAVSEPLSRPLVFLTGSPAQYTDEQIKEMIDFPAILFAGLSEEDARRLAAMFRDRGLEVDATDRVDWSLSRGKKRRVGLMMIPIGFWAAGVGTAFHSSLMALGLAGAMAVFAAMVLKSRSELRSEIFQLRDQLAPVWVADGLLSDAALAATRIRAPEVRALFVEVSTEIYRLSRRAAQLAKRAEAGPILRTLDATKALLGRAFEIATKLDALDAALGGTTEGELMAAVSRLERAGASDTTAAARRELESLLDQRDTAERQRAQIAASLCALLARLRLAARTATDQEAEGDAEAAALEAATAEVEALLTAVPT
ncbi:MAG TPA: serine/threonine-protein kinase [Polyangia bacterium]|nr:serine/threonine-protein kinase [Polyangia bacterium]